ncbi:hypothetical protein [Moorena producens]|uniref:hypothetical protein n=1 Tax=Moorena producens TaxID=1155739 RepID=UPI00131447B6|nr:hypothetical protein [Moorena producens]
MQRGLGEPVRSWGGSAVLGVSPMSDCRGSPHDRTGVVSPMSDWIKTLSQVLGWCVTGRFQARRG